MWGGRVSSDEKTGRCSISYWAIDDADDSDKANRYLEAYFGFMVENNLRPGKLEVTVEYHVDQSSHNIKIYDEPGFSALDFLAFQRTHFWSYKKVGDDWETLHEYTGHHHDWDWKTTTGRGDADYEHTLKNVPEKRIITSERNLDINQQAIFFFGIWGGLALWTNDYGYNVTGDFDITLNSVTATIR